MVHCCDFFGFWSRCGYIWLWLSSTAALSFPTPAGKADKRHGWWRGRPAPCSITPWCTMAFGRRTSERPAWRSQYGTTTDYTTTLSVVWGSDWAQVRMRLLQPWAGRLQQSLWNDKLSKALRVSWVVWRELCASLCREELRVGRRLDGLNLRRGRFVAEDVTVGKRMGGGYCTAENVNDGKMQVRSCKICQWMCGRWQGEHLMCLGGKFQNYTQKCWKALE